jgi:enoyl-CoA hydratase/carnithine racemase
VSVAWHEREGGRIVEVVVDRPEALNAVDFGVMIGLEDALTHAEKSHAMRVFALRGAGERAFISGGDLKAFAVLQTAEDGAAMARRMTSILARIEALPAFTVAGVNGPAYGGGTETALAFDMRIVAHHATFGFTQTRFAVPPGWGGLTRMVELVGASRTLHWLGTSAVVGADEAHETGLANAVAEPGAFDATFDEQLRRLCRNDRRMIATLKAGARRARELDRGAAIAAELEPFADHWGSDAHHARVQAFLDRD